MTSEDILTELLIEAHAEGIFEKVLAEVNKLKQNHIITDNNRLELFEKAIKNVRRNKTI
jgi:hypothetical protein